MENAQHLDETHPGSAGILKPGRLLWLRALAWMIALSFLTGVTVVGIDLLGQRILPPSLVLLRVAVALICAFAIYILAVRYVEQRRPVELSLTRAPWELLAGLLVGFGLMALVLAVLMGLGLYRISFHEPDRISAALALTLQSGFFEELLLRGIMLRLLWRAFGPAWALVITSCIFGALHAGNAGATILSSVAIALEAGLLLGAFYILTSRLWLPIGIHMAWNFTQGWIFGAPVSGIAIGGGLATSSPIAGSPEFLSGGAFGPEASLPAIIICTSAGVLVLWRAWGRGMFNPAIAGPGDDPRIRDVAETATS